MLRSTSFRIYWRITSGTHTVDTVNTEVTSGPEGDATKHLALKNGRTREAEKHNADFRKVTKSTYRYVGATQGH